MRKRYKLADWLKLFWGILLAALVALFLFFNVRINEMLTEQTAKRLDDTMTIYVNGIDASMDSIEKNLRLSLEDSEEVIRIESGIKGLPYDIARYKINQTLKKFLAFDSSTCELVFYYEGKNGRVSIDAGNISHYRQNWQLANSIKESLADRMPGKSNDYFTVGDSVFIVRYQKVNNSYLGVCMSTESVFSALSRLYQEKGVELFITDEEGTLIDATMPIGQLLLPEQNGSFVSIDGQEYLMSEKKSAEGGFYVGALAHRDVIFREGKQITDTILLLFVILTAAGLPGIFLVVNRFISRPIGEMAAGMQQLGAGNFDARISSKSMIREYYALENTFNEMSAEIKDLKIANYENQIKRQKAQLQYLQLQISPHFYLNALNIIYSLAQIKDFEQIQKMTLHLVNYSRYMFHDSQELVTLQEELKHVREYIEIQKMRFGDFDLYREEVEERLYKLLVPPFILQSFVENSVKYALRNREGSCMWLRAGFGEDEQTVILTVRDNGSGYPQEVLDAVNQDHDIDEDSEKHVGIRNVKERLHMIYGCRASVRFFNEQGAVTQIRLPVILKE